MKDIRLYIYKHGTLRKSGNLRTGIRKHFLKI